MLVSERKARQIQMFTGTIINGVLIVIGGAFGCLFKKGLPKRFEQILTATLALAVMYVGISGMAEGGNSITAVISLALGALVGEFVNFDKHLNNLGRWVQNKFSRFGNPDFSKGFVNCTIIFCVGAMAIVGSVESAVNLNHDILITKAIMDGVLALITAASLGAGVMLSGVSVVVYQGIIVVCAGFFAQYLTDAMSLQLSCVGSVLIFVIGLNLLKITNIKVANLILAPFIAALITVFFE